MNDAMDVALFLTDRLFRNVGTRVARGLEASLPEVDAHMGRVEQALVNVLVNACEAGGSEVRVSTGMAEDGRTVLTRIEDNGCGVAEKDLPRVFEPFFSTRGKLGIGLTAARELVANEGGTLEFESKAGKGAVVTIHLPSAQQDTR
jgi:two-component system NtrC family sensor kinase